MANARALTRSQDCAVIASAARDGRRRRGRKRSTEKSPGEAGLSCRNAAVVGCRAFASEGRVSPKAGGARRGGP
jgi:hypothetical protein